MTISDGEEYAIVSTPNAGYAIRFYGSGGTFPYLSTVNGICIDMKTKSSH